MNKKQEDKLSMYSRVKLVLQQNQALYSLLVALANAITLFTTRVTELETVISDQLFVMLGVGDHKKSVREIVTDKTLEFAGALMAYASLTNDLELEKKVSFTRSQLIKMRDEKLKEFANYAYDQCSNLLPLLGNYGITAASLTAYRTVIDDYILVAQAPSSAKSNKAFKTKELKRLIKVCDRLLKTQVDKLMLQMRTTQPAFYGHFAEARKIVDSGHRKRIEIVETITGSVYITVIDSETLEPIEDAAVTVIEAGVNDRTDEDGIVYFDTLNASKITIQAVKDGYAEYLEKEYKIEEAKDADLVINLSKITDPSSTTSTGNTTTAE